MKTIFPDTKTTVLKISVLLSCPRIKLSTRADFCRFVKDAFPELKELIDETMLALALHQPYVSDDFVTPPTDRPIMAWWTISNPGAPEWREDGCCGLQWSKEFKTWLRASDENELRQSSGDEMKIRVWCEMPI